MFLVVITQQGMGCCIGVGGVGVSIGGTGGGGVIVFNFGNLKCNIARLML